MLTVRVQDGPRELRAAVLAMKRADKEVRGQISQDLRTVMGPEWTTMLAQHLTGLPQEAMLMAGARIAAGNPPMIVAANSKRKFGRALIPAEDWTAWEYGVSKNRGTPSVYERRNRGGGGSHQVSRHIRTSLPRWKKDGRVIGPAVKRFLPRVCAFWVQSVVRAFMDAAETRS